MFNLDIWKKEKIRDLLSKICTGRIYKEKGYYTVQSFNFPDKQLKEELQKLGRVVVKRSRIGSGGTTLLHRNSVEGWRVNVYF